MALINEDYLKLPEDYLFTEINKKVNIFKVTRPASGSKVIHLDKGDASCILQNEISNALLNSVKEMADMNSTHSADTVSRTKELINLVLKTDYESRGIKLGAEEVFLNDSALNAASEVSDFLSKDNIIGVFDPSYPAYIYNNVMNGRAGEKMGDGHWSNLVYIPCDESCNFSPMPPKERVDVIYLSLPNNPTGTTLTTEELKKWIKYALATKTLIIFDASHAHYIQDKKVPRSIYEIKGAQKCAIELRSFSKTTGYTGTDFAFTVVPKEVFVYTEVGESISLNKIWHRKQTSKFSGLPYMTLCSAEALYTPQGQKELKERTEYYMMNAEIIRTKLLSKGLKVVGGENSPYVWAKTPEGVTSWRFFEQLLYEHNVVCTPGVGFCPGGEGYVRFTGFATREDTIEAMARL